MSKGFFLNGTARCSSHSVTPQYDLQYFQIMEAIKRSLINTLDCITMKEPKTTKPVMFKLINYKRALRPSRLGGIKSSWLPSVFAKVLRKKEYSKKTNSFPQQLEDVSLQIFY